LVHLYYISGAQPTACEDVRKIRNKKNQCSRKKHDDEDILLIHARSFIHTWYMSIPVTKLHYILLLLRSSLITPPYRTLSKISRIWLEACSVFLALLTYVKKTFPRMKYVRLSDRANLSDEHVWAQLIVMTSNFVCQYKKIPQKKQFQRAHYLIPIFWTSFFNIFITLFFNMRKFFSWKRTRHEKLLRHFFHIL